MLVAIQSLLKEGIVLVLDFDAFQNYTHHSIMILKVARNLHLLSTSTFVNSLRIC